MSNHFRPESIAPNDQRCEALVYGKADLFWEWTKHDRRCSRRAQQMRGGLAVCYAHSIAKIIVRADAMLEARESVK